MEFIFWIAFALLVYTYAIYPAVAVIIGAGRVEQASDELPAVSVLVPAHNEAGVIAAKVENFRSLDYPSDLIELVIADDGSTDGTADLVRSLEDERVHLVDLGTRAGKASAMNRLVGSAKHPLILFSDANVMFASSAVRRLVDHLAMDAVGAVTGEVRLVDSGQEFGAGEQLYYWFERRIQGAESRLASVMGVDGGMYIVRRELIPSLPANTILDDFAVSMHVMRSRRRVVYESAAKATESGTPSARQEFSRRVRIAAGAVQLLKRGMVPRWNQPVLWLQFLSHKLLRWGSPLLFAALLLSNAALLNDAPVYQVLFIAQLLVGVVMLAAWKLAPLRQTAVGAVMFYFGISQVAMGLGLMRGMLDRQTATWERGERALSRTSDPVRQ
ncbi:glycosyltransferase family 2 protein [Roseiconus nitratireducens]|uniref:glycosyltransferase family 2 protein n=1 Tax=Roseiconus nitratireducens TaxID=2605748 RepID=UPI001F2CE42D|nr:glycosyltransferase family 2 protein [Roseiconus nitratireducens]